LPSAIHLHLSLLLMIAALGSACSQRFAVSINDQSLYDPRPNTTSYRFSDPGLQACVNFALREPGSQLEDIRVLSCAEWEVQEIEGIGILRSLQFLDLSGNQINSLAPLANLPRLSSLSAVNNRIIDITPLIGLTSLTSATLAGNNNIPCAQLDRLETRLGANLRRPDTCRNGN
jgi:hypothetical protein